MKRLLLIFILTLNFQSLTKANDSIKDFQIGGMSIGDSALQYFDKETIISSIKETSYFDDGFYDVSLESNDDKYEYYTLSFKKDDNNYIAYSITGINNMNFNNCLQKKKIVVKEIKQNLQNFKENNYKDFFKKNFGKSFATVTDFIFEDGSIRIWCDNWDKKHETAKFWDNSLNIDVSSEEFLLWLDNQAYK
jgi:hypothetical protein